MKSTTEKIKLKRTLVRDFKGLLWDFFDGGYATGLAGREKWKTDEDYNKHIDWWFKKHFKPLIEHSINQAVEEKEKYIGKLKRQWYMKGVRDREKEIVKKINAKYLPNRFADSHTGVMTFGVQEPTCIRRPTTKEIEFKSFLDELSKKEE